MCLKRRSVIFPLLLLLGISSLGITSLSSRQKRFIIWPPNTAKIQIIAGLGVPVDLQPENAIIGLVVKTNYPMPQNASIWRQGFPGIYYERKKRSLMSRWDIYDILAKESEMSGQGGRACVLRAICEAADTPMDETYGFFDEIFHETFTPSATKEELSHYTDNEYFGAEELGLKYKGKCKQFFPECEKSFLEKYTEIYSH